MKNQKRFIATYMKGMTPLNLLHFETLKFVRKKKTFVLLLLAISLPILNYILSGLFDTHETERADFAIQASEAENSAQQIEDISQNEPAAKQVAKQTKEEATILEQLVSDVSSNDWATFLKHQIAYDQLQLKGIEEGSAPLDAEELSRIHKQIKLNTYLEKHHLEPEISGADRYGINYTQQFLSVTTPFLMFVLVLFAVIDILNNEKKLKTRDFMNMVPTSKNKLIQIKLMLNALFALFLVIIVAFTSFLTGLIGKGSGTFHYPVLFQNPATDQIRVDTIGVWLLKYFGLALLFILLITLTAILISKISAGDVVNAMILLAILFLPSALGKYNSGFDKVLPFLPSSYLNIPSLLSGEALSQNAQLTFTNAIWSCSAFIILLYIVIFVITKIQKKI
ncbi:hypothetical protein ACYRFT_10730 [Listeria kieliensis]